MLSHSDFDDWQLGFSSLKPSWLHHCNTGTRSFCLNSMFVAALEVLVKLHSIFIVIDMVIFSLSDSPSPCFQASIVSPSSSPYIMLANVLSFIGFKVVRVCLSVKYSQV
ncbi:unnamed protein product [Brassica oleracea var. botrytis]|uniref:(rape) hypothetical protein n=1 Tax=Brassica napus TaxID=3708 RepID=A0A816U7W4_BRANA|nr:unnamed protein product [Brassica napus]